MLYDKNRGYSKAQITNMLYEYMVNGQKAAYVCKEILNMTPDEIGNTRAAYTKLRPIYKSYGFAKRYNDGLAFRNITWNKLGLYVDKYWNVTATEQDLVNFFSEIEEDFKEGKIIDAKNGGSWESGSEGHSYMDNANYEPRKPINYYQNTSVNTPRTNDNISDKIENYFKKKRKNQNSNSNYNNLGESNKKESSDETAIIFAGVIVIIIAMVVWKSGIVTSIGNGITNLFGTILWILELVLFYGGILLFIVAIVKKAVKKTWMFCVGLTVKITNNIKLYVYKFGIGVFTIEDDFFLIQSNKYADTYCDERKKTHSDILSFTAKYSSQLLRIINGIRIIVMNNHKVVRASARDDWENNGLSYVMTMSVIQNSKIVPYSYKEFEEIEKKNLAILLEPSIAHKEDSVMISLDSNDESFDPYAFDINEIEDPKNWIKSKDCSIYISWAAVVAYVNCYNYKMLEFLEYLEVDLQAMWLYVYCKYYDLRNKNNNGKRVVSELKRELFDFRKKYNRFNCKTDSSIPIYVTKVRDELIRTSGIDIEKDKYEEYISFYIDETESISIENQRKYSTLSEILLFVIAFIQIAPMGYSFLHGEYKGLDVGPVIFLCAAAIIGVIFILRKD